MTTDSQITKQTPFHERIYDRIRESMGELLTTEEAQKLVDRAIEEGLFKERTECYGFGKTRPLPSLFVEMVTDEVRPLVKEAIQEWIKANPGTVKSVIQEVLQDGILAAGYRALQDHLQGPTFHLQAKLDEALCKLTQV